MASTRDSAGVYTLNWGILATGYIAEKFAGDLLIDPLTRGIGDVSHVVAAVASSSSKAKAVDFIAKLNIPSYCAAYGSYDELFKDQNVDIVYVASPHSHHYRNVMMALQGGKHVVCEKPLTVNAAQAKKLYEKAKDANLFLLDAVWTRYFPLSVQIRDIIKKGEIGEVLRVVADLSEGNDLDEWWGVQKHRKFRMDFAGGALLEVGVYSITWIFQALYHTLPKEQRRPPTKISSTMAIFNETGVDEDTTVLLSFPTTSPTNSMQRLSHGVGMSAFRLMTDPDQRGSAGPAIRIQGTEGEIQVDHPAYRPERFRVIPGKKPDQPLTIREIHCSFPGDGHGMFWEADEAARCIKIGKIQSDIMPWEESILVMEVIDEVRKQNGLIYPTSIESTDIEI